MDSSVMYGGISAPGNKYEMYEIPFSKMIQPRLGVTWAYDAKGTVYADTVEVVTASTDRRPGVEGRCGGSDYSHIAYARQLLLKGAVIEDAWRRLARPVRLLVGYSISFLRLGAA